MEQTEMRPVRWHLLDNIRGVCIILVVLYHVLYNLSEVFGGNYAFFRSDGMNTFRDCFVSVLVILAGLSCSLSRSNIKRGLKTFAFALVITAVTALFMKDSLIVFGILHFFGVAMLLYGASGKVLQKLPTYIGLPLFLMLFIITWDIYYGFIGIPGLFQIDLPSVPEDPILFILGFGTGHYSADYYPIMPWLFLFLAGSYLGKYFKNGTAPKIFKANPIPPLGFIGRHTMWIYLLHQPIIFGTMYLFFEVSQSI